MSDDVHSRTEIVGSSEIGVDDAVRGAIARASRTLADIDWFEASGIRGHVQVTLQVGFAPQDTKP